MHGLELAKNELLKNNYTCVIVSGERVVMTSRKRGVKPLLFFCEEYRREGFNPLVLADKAIGRAAALLAAFCGIQEIYTEIISLQAREALALDKIPVTYERIVPYIRNRTGDGRCPMEELCLGIKDPYRAYLKIKECVDGGL